MGLFKYSNQKEKTLFSFFREEKIYRTSHWVNHKELKELNVNNLFEREKMIEDMDAELTGALKKTSNTDDLAVVEEGNVDEAITAEAKASNEKEINLKEEQNTQA